MGTSVAVSEVPDCDFCKEDGLKTPARVDGKTRMGPWANMCEQHYLNYGIGLGTGKGQILIPLKGTE
jgi:hypothetical protein